MRTFVLIRDEDVTGVSGTGTVAEGVEFSDGRVALRWIVGEHRSTVTWDSVESVLAIHGHNGATRLVWEEMITECRDRMVKIENQIATIQNLESPKPTTE
jgi:hypothetical protein